MDRGWARRLGWLRQFLPRLEFQAVDAPASDADVMDLSLDSPDLTLLTSLDQPADEQAPGSASEPNSVEPLVSADGDGGDDGEEQLIFQARPMVISFRPSPLVALERLGSRQAVPFVVAALAVLALAPAASLVPDDLPAAFVASVQQSVQQDGLPSKVAPAYLRSVPSDPAPDITYEWTFDGRMWRWGLDLPDHLEAEYADRTLLYEPNGAHAYGAYALTTADDDFLQHMADVLRAVAEGEGWNDRKLLEFALRFVQELEFTADDASTGFDEYPRYPVETLRHRGGDCEDTSILFAGIAAALGHEVALLNPHGHMAAGLADPDGGYTYVETTGSGWQIGEIPPEHKGKSIRVLSLDPQPFFRVEATGVAGLVAADLRVTVHNDGNAAAHELRVYADVMVNGARDRMTWCDIGSLQPGERFTCNGRVAPPVGTQNLQLRYTLVQDGRTALQGTVPMTTML